MTEDEKLFYTIGEVAQKLNVKPYVLRYWESEFRKLNPQKSVTGQRAYRVRDIRVALTIHRLLYHDKFTIAGARQKLDELDELQSLDPFDVSAASMPVEQNGGETGGDSKGKRDTPVELELEIIRLIEETKSILRKYGIET